MLDIKLKNESGIDLLQKWSKSAMKCRLSSVRLFPVYKDDFSAWLADGYVVKSSDLTELKEEIARVLAKKGRGKGS